MKRETLHTIIICILLLALYALVQKQNNDTLIDGILIKQNNAIKAERDSISRINKTKDQFFFQHIDSLYSIVDDLAVKKTLTEAEIKSLKKRIKDAEDERKAKLEQWK